MIFKVAEGSPSGPSAPAAAGLRRLSEARPGDRGRIIAVTGESAVAGAVDQGELERRLLEFGLVEGAAVEVLHQGPFGGDPIAARIDGALLALRRAEAYGVIIQSEAPDVKDDRAASAGAGSQ